MAKKAEQKNLNIKDATEADIRAFQQIKEQHKLTSKEALAALLTKFTEQTPDTQGVSPEDHQRVTEENQQLTEKIQILTTSEADLKEKIKNLIIQLQEAQNQAAQAVSLPQHAFICIPRGRLPEILEAVKQKFYSKGWVKITDPEQYHNEFAIYAMKYLLENEFPSFLRV